METMAEVVEFINTVIGAISDDMPSIISGMDSGGASNKKCLSGVGLSIMKVKSISSSFNPEDPSSCMPVAVAMKVKDQLSVKYVNKNTSSSRVSSSTATALSPSQTITYLVDDSFAIISDDDGTKIIVD